MTPGGQIPLGPTSAGGQKLFTIGGGANLSVEYSLPFAPVVCAQGLVPRLEAQLSGIGGYATGLYPGAIPGGAPFVNAEAMLLHYFLNSFAIGFGASYNYYFGAYNGVGVFLEASFRPQLGPVRAQIQIPKLQLDPVFPVFYKYYDDHSVGKVILRNEENETIRDVKVSFYVQQDMMQPKEYATIKELTKGGHRNRWLYSAEYAQLSRRTFEEVIS